jgi:hypothetical protein
VLRACAGVFQRVGMCVPALSSGPCPMAACTPLAPSHQPDHPPTQPPRSDINSTLPAELGNLTNLEQLLLSNERLGYLLQTRHRAIYGSLPRQLAGLKSLKHLTLECAPETGMGAAGAVIADVQACTCVMQASAHTRTHAHAHTPSRTHTHTHSHTRTHTHTHTHAHTHTHTVRHTTPSPPPTPYSYNYLTGTLPPEWANLTVIEEISLGNEHSLTGPLPPAWSALHKLRRLAVE